MEHSAIRLQRAPVSISEPVHRFIRRLHTRRSDYVVHGVKTLIAALLTWSVAARWAPGGQPYMAVATALLMVNASTVYRSVTKAAQNVFARVAALVVALVAARLFGQTAVAVAVIAVIAVLAGPRRRTDDRLQIGSTAVITLAASATAPTGMGGLLSPVLQTLAGAVVGIVVNAFILPPLYLDESDTAVRDVAHDMGSLLDDMGAGLAGGQLADEAHIWLDRARDLEKQLRYVEEQVQQTEESLRWNPRGAILGLSRDTTYNTACTTLRGVSIQVRGIARTLADNAHDDHTEHHLGWQFLDRYAENLQLAGAAVRGAIDSPDTHHAPETSPREQLRGAIDNTLTWHDSMTDLIGRGALIKPGAWHVYGSLMTDVERLLADLDRADLVMAA